MSNRLWLVPAVVAMGYGAPLTAQSVDDLRRKVEHVGARWRVLADSAQTDQRRRFEATVLDTSVVGPLRIVAVSGWDRFRQPIATRVAERLVHALSADTTLLVGRTLLMGFPGTATVFRVGDTWITLPGLEATTVWEAAIDTTRTIDDTVQRIVDLIGDQLVPSDHELRSWLGGKVPFAESDLVEPGLLFTRLVTGRSPAVGVCLIDGVGCRSVLFPDVAADPWTEWINAGGRREVVQGFRGSSDPLVAACVEDESDAACLQYLRTSLPQPDLPVMGAGRQALVWHALTMGGDGSIGRLLAPAPTVPDRLEAAAGLPVDSVIGAWRSWVVAGRPTPAPAARRTRWMAMVWASVFVTLALRSSRWR